jgi:eukaryotic-like serine/threonine-protein kinase
MPVLKRKSEWPVPEDREVTGVIEERGAPPPLPPQRPPWGDLGPWLLILLLLVLGGLAAAYFLTRDDNGKGSSAPATTVVTTVSATTAPAAIKPAPAAARIRVPYVVGKTAPAAVKRLVGDKLRPQVKGVFAAKPRGIVVSQKPTAGTPLKKGSLVVLNVSKGRPTVPVPDVVGQTSQQAVELLRAAGFGARVVEVPSDQAPGTVVAQNPKAGGKVARATIVRLNVAKAGATTAASTTTAPAPATTTPAATAPPATTTSARPVATRVTVPNVVGNPLAKARASIRKSGLVTEVRYVPNSQPEATVVAQSPKPGTSAKRGDHVLLTVSRGPKPKQEVPVPDVVGRNEASARSQLQSAGFTVSVQDSPTTDPSQDGLVVDEQPAAGTTAPRGSEVTIYVGGSSG